MSKSLFKKTLTFGFGTALILSALPAYAGVFGGPQNYTLKADIIQCLQEDTFLGEEMPDDLADIPALENHPACGNLKSRVLAKIEMPLQNKRTKIWNNLKNVTIVGKNFDHTLDPEKGFVFEVQDKTAESIKTGVEVKAYLDATNRRKPMLSMLVKHYSADSSSEEMVVTSGGEVYLNPYPREVVRMVRIHTPVKVNKDDIWGGEGVFLGVAPVNIPHLYPENARLWVSGKIEK